MKNRGFIGTILIVLVVIISVTVVYIYHDNNYENRNTFIIQNVKEINQDKYTQEEFNNYTLSEDKEIKNNKKDVSVSDVEDGVIDSIKKENVNNNFEICGNMRRSDVLDSSKTHDQNLFHKMNLDCVNERWRFMDMQCPENWNYYFVNSDFSIDAHEKGECI